MSSDERDQGCCTDSAGAPSRANPPGHSSLRYRVGTQPTFFERMINQLSRQIVPPEGDPATADRPLAELSTRALDDPTIGLIDAWACVLDVLTFYDERTIQEGYLPTAVERASVHAIARSIGYSPSPGVAASTRLAFTLDDSEAAPDSVVIPAGTAVKSIPTAQPDLDLDPEDLLPQTFETSASLTARSEWNAIPASVDLPHTPKKDDTLLYLEGTATRLSVGDPLVLLGKLRSEDGGAELTERWDLRFVTKVEVDSDAQRTKVTLDRGLGDEHTDPAASDQRVFAFRERASLFGHNAPDLRALSADLRGSSGFNTGTKTTWPKFSLAEDHTTGAYLKASPKRGVIDLDREYAKLVEGSWICLEGKTQVELYKVELVSPASRSDFTLAGKVSRVFLDGWEHLTHFGRRSTTIHMASEELKLARAPDTSAVSGSKIRLKGTPTKMEIGREIFVRGLEHPSGTKRVETCTVAGWHEVGDGHDSELTLTTKLSHSYQRDTVEILGNVVAATHGETLAREALGSGDASKANQRFNLRQSPMTWVSSTSASGRDPTLELRVDGVLWTQAADGLHQAGPRDRVYELSTDSEAKTTLVFGDGIRGARLPTGVENVIARYRKGVGLVGEVGADQIGLLAAGPPGVRKVQNPIAADGAEDPELLDEARKNAPLTVLTLDRLVSVSDYEDFARTFAGVGKAKAAALWDGKRGFVHVTVASSSGKQLAQNSTTIEKLIAAFDRYGDPSHTVIVSPHDPAWFAVNLRLLRDPAYAEKAVAAAVQAALKAAFCFAKREFAQPVSASEVLAVVHGVAGVQAVDLDALHRKGRLAKPHALVSAARASWTGYSVARAELLLVDPSLITLSWMKTP